jgi:hypothetical protein
MISTEGLTVHAELGNHRSARSLQGATLAKLLLEPMLAEIAKDQKRVAAFKKRLQRARKFSLIKGIFGERVLEATPEICVTRMDRIKLDELQRLRSGSVEGVRIKRIIMKMVGG